jgi:predicted nucleotidyltransferase
MKKIKEEKILKPPITSKLLKKISHRIVKKIKPDKIILFGSYAYGNPNPDSDLDFFIIKDTELSFIKRFGWVSDALYPRLIPMDFIVKTPKEVEERLKLFDPFIKEIINNGKVLYEKKIKL